MDRNTFEDLKVYQRAYAASLDVHRKSLEFPKVEQYGLARQMRTASKSICANLAEGHGKKASQAEFRRFIQIAIGSADEMQVWINYCRDLGYVSETQCESWKSEYREIAKMLNGLSRATTL